MLPGSALRKRVNQCPLSQVTILSTFPGMVSARVAKGLPGSTRSMLSVKRCRLQSHKPRAKFYSFFFGTRANSFRSYLLSSPRAIETLLSELPSLGVLVDERLFFLLCSSRKGVKRARIESTLMSVIIGRDRITSAWLVDTSRVAGTRWAPLKAKSKGVKDQVS